MINLEPQTTQQSNDVKIPIDNNEIDCSNGVTVKWSNLKVDVKPKREGFFKRLCCKKGTSKPNTKTIIRGSTYSYSYISIFIVL